MLVEVSGISSEAFPPTVTLNVAVASLAVDALTVTEVMVPSNPLVFSVIVLAGLLPLPICMPFAVEFESQPK